MAMKRPLKVLIPNFRAADSFTDNVAHCLTAMGCEVRTMTGLSFRDKGRIPRILHDGWMGYRPDTWTAQEKFAVEVARDWQPDLVLTLTLALRPEVLAELKRLGTGRCVAWWGDPPANMKGMSLLADGWDKIYIKDPDGVAKFRAVGLDTDLLHEAMNPDWHKPVPGGSAADAGAVIVAGNYYGYRQFLVTRLAEAGVDLALYGSRPPRWSIAVIRDNFRAKYLVREEKSQTFGAGLACLNSTSMWEGNSLNCRAFEICGAGGLQLIEAKPIVSDCFEPGREVLTYNSVDEIFEHLARARREPDWARAIREAGLARAHAEHTYGLRLKRILKDVDLPCGDPADES